MTESWKMTYHGEVPSKKNSRILTIIRGRPISLPSKRYKEWHKDMTSQCHDIVKFYSNEEQTLRITVQIWYKTKRRGDLDNKLASILDWATDLGIIPDDDAKVVQEIHLYYMGVDRYDPHVQIMIEIIENPLYGGLTR